MVLKYIEQMMFSYHDDKLYGLKIFSFETNGHREVQANISENNRQP